MSETASTERLLAELDKIPNRRAAGLDDVEVSEWSEGFRFEGHAAVYGEIADLGDFVESVERGAFKKVLALNESVPLLYEHQIGLPLLASTRSGTLRLAEDERGLAVEANVADTTLGRDLRVLAKRGDLPAMSYGFVAGRGNSRIERRSGKPHRILTGFRKLLDVSLSPDPVFASAEGSFGSLAMKYVDSPDELRELVAGAFPAVPWPATNGAAGGSRLAARKRRLAELEQTLSASAALLAGIKDY